MLGCSKQQDGKNAVKGAMAMPVLQRGAATMHVGEGRSDYVLLTTKAVVG